MIWRACRKITAEDGPGIGNEFDCTGVGANDAPPWSRIFTIVSLLHSPLSKRWWHLTSTVGRETAGDDEANSEADRWIVVERGPTVGFEYLHGPVVLHPGQQHKKVSDGVVFLAPVSKKPVGGRSSKSGKTIEDENVISHEFSTWKIHRITG